MDTSVNNNDVEFWALELISAIEIRIPDIFDLKALKVKFPVLYEESLNTVIC